MIDLFGNVMTRFYLTTKDADWVVEIDAIDEEDLFSKMDKLAFPGYEAGGRFFTSRANDNRFVIEGEIRTPKRIITTSEYLEMQEA